MYYSMIFFNKANSSPIGQDYMLKVEQTHQNELQAGNRIE